jgi:hypothetical protein
VPESLPDDAEYELAPTDAPAPPDPPSQRSRLPTATPVAPVALAYQTNKVDPAAPAEPETIKNFYMPVWLLWGGIVVETAAAFLRRGNTQVALAGLGIGLVAGTALMLIGVLIAARIRQINLGTFWTAVFKLAAISVGPGAIVTLLSPLLNHIPLGGLIGWVGEFVLYFALLGALFDLDQDDTWYCIVVIFLVKLGVYFALLGIVAAMR